MSTQSEFGAGLVVCLAKFSEHLRDVNSWLETYKLTGTGEKDRTSDAIRMAMNGASDHFYELDRDLAPAPLIELADLTLRIGHGFVPAKKYDEETLKEIYRLWRESCIALDHMLGTKPDWGEW